MRRFTLVIPAAVLFMAACLILPAKSAPQKFPSLNQLQPYNVALFVERVILAFNGDSTRFNQAKRLKLDPESAQSLNNLGVAFYLSESPAKAMEYLAAVRKAPLILGRRCSIWEKSLIFNEGLKRLGAVGGPALTSTPIRPGPQLSVKYCPCLRRFVGCPQSLTAEIDKKKRPVLILFMEGIGRNVETAGGGLECTRKHPCQNCA